MKPIIFPKIDGGKLEIGIEALSKMQKYIQNNSFKREAGGVLLGRYIKDSLDIVIDEVTVPMWGDRRGLFNFFRARRPHQKIIDRRWKDSEGTINYLGEWHTHPESIPIPSNRDINDWERKLNEDFFDGNSLHFIILGIEGLRAWELSKKSMTRELIGEFWYSELKNV
ncbi:MAG: Mov34/MPN/PAD-1 family protein [Waterburya sp.]